MRKVLVLHSSSDLYGASKIIYIASLLMKRNGVHPIVCLSEYGPLCDKLKELDIEYIIIPLCEIRRKYFNLFGVLNRILVLFKSFYYLNKYIRANKIDTIYSNTTAIFIGSLYAWLFKKVHIWHVHEIIHEPALLKVILKILMKMSKSKIIVVSEAVRDNWSNDLDDKIHVIQNGINHFEYLGDYSSLREELKFGNEDGLFVIGMIGRLNAWKGHHYFLKIAKELVIINSAFSQKLRFVIVGDVFPGEEYRYHLLEQEISLLGLVGSVSFLGFRKDIPNILKGIDLFVLPSIKPDPFPTVILESFFSAKAVVATNHGGAIEMIKGNENGILIPWDNAKVAAKMINELLLNRETLVEMGIHARENAFINYTMAKFEERLFSIIELIK